jgi:hypothetical protein
MGRNRRYKVLETGLTGREKTHFVRYFLNEKEAARAYDAAILPLAGELVHLNFPKG